MKKIIILLVVLILSSTIEAQSIDNKIITIEKHLGFIEVEIQTESDIVNFNLTSKLYDLSKYPIKTEYIPQIEQRTRKIKKGTVTREIEVACWSVDKNICVTGPDAFDKMLCDNDLTLQKTEIKTCTHRYTEPTYIDEYYNTTTYIKTVPILATTSREKSTYLLDLFQQSSTGAYTMVIPTPISNIKNVGFGSQGTASFNPAVTWNLTCAQRLIINYTESTGTDTIREGYPLCSYWYNHTNANDLFITANGTQIDLDCQEYNGTHFRCCHTTIEDVAPGESTDNFYYRYVNCSGVDMMSDTIQVYYPQFNQDSDTLAFILLHNATGTAPINHGRTDITPTLSPVPPISEDGFYMKGLYFNREDTYKFVNLTSNNEMEAVRPGYCIGGIWRIKWSTTDNDNAQIFWRNDGTGMTYWYNNGAYTPTQCLRTRSTGTTLNIFINWVEGGAQLPNVDKWIFSMFCENATHEEVWINGTLVNSTFDSGTFTTTPSSLMLGATSSGTTSAYSLNGTIELFMEINRTLTADEHNSYWLDSPPSITFGEIELSSVDVYTCFIATSPDGERWANLSVTIVEGTGDTTTLVLNESGENCTDNLEESYNVTIGFDGITYTSSINSMNVTPLVPIDSEGAMSLTLTNTVGFALEGQFCDVYATDSDGRVVKTFNTLPPYDGAQSHTNTSRYPRTNTLGEYILSFLVDSDHFYYNHSYSLVAVCNGQTASQSFDVGLSRKQPLTRTMDEVRNDAGYWVLMGIRLIIGVWFLNKLIKRIFKR